MDTPIHFSRSGRLSHFLLAILLTLAGANSAHAWWNNEWTIRKKITLDASGTGAATTESTGPVAVLVRLYDGNFRFGEAKPDASDIRFVAEDDKTLLSYHIEKFDPLLNEAFVWVKVPDLKPGTKNTIWLYYGNAGNKAVKVEDPKGTYDDSTVLVYHFGEHGQAAYDSTGTGNNAASPGIPSDSSLIGTGLRLDGRTAVTVPGSASLAWRDGGSATVSCWVKYTGPQPGSVILSRRGAGKAFVLGIDSGVPYVDVRSGGASQRAAGAAITAGAWHHLAVVASGSMVRLFVDGDQVGSIGAPLPGLDGALQIGGDASSGNGMVGELDELQISNSARSASALKAAAVGQGTEGSSRFISFGEDQQQTSWLSALRTGYVGVIVGSLSVDGWVVIGILGVMFIVSASVMVTKAMYINRITKGNEQFLKEWSQVATDLSVLENPAPTPAQDSGKVKSSSGSGLNAKARKNAPLYHIYHTGVAEIQNRMAADRPGRTVAPWGTKVLSARSIHAIRATLDAGLIRETQKLNDKMVFLTIAISGGPFLGLLGTVVGVMITFAAVAQAGDVNVNAIAPGIAAALLATVAGLGVAIPSLFGYNYLVTRIKSTSTDMHVFVDEFVTKMAEFYSQQEADVSKADH